MILSYLFEVSFPVTHFVKTFISVYIYVKYYFFVHGVCQMIFDSEINIDSRTIVCTVNNLGVTQCKLCFCLVWPFSYFASKYQYFLSS